MSRFKFVLVFSVLAGCASTPASSGDVTAATHPENPGGEHGHHHGGHHGEHHGDMPAQVTAFHDVLAPVWHSDAGAARDDRACQQAATYRERASAVTAMPVPAAAQANSAAWTAAAAQLSARSEALATACGATPRGDVNAALTELHTAFHGLMEPLGRGHH